MKILLSSPEELSKSGVYCIKNTINKKVYIGSTKNTFKRRFYEHTRLLKALNHHNLYLMRSVNKYSIENFEFSILEIIDKKEVEIIRERERYYINKFNSFLKEKGYNFDDNTLAPPSTESIRERVSKTLKNKYKNDPIYRQKMRELSLRKKGKPSWNKGVKCNNISEARKKMFCDIEVYDLNMKFFKRFDNSLEIEKYSKSKNDLPIPDFIPFIGRNKYTKDNTKISYQPIKNKIVISQNIHRAIRDNKHYKGLFFKKVPRDSDVSSKQDELLEKL